MLSASWAFMLGESWGEYSPSNCIARNHMTGCLRTLGRSELRFWTSFGNNKGDTCGQEAGPGTRTIGRIIKLAGIWAAHRARFALVWYLGGSLWKALWKLPLIEKTCSWPNSSSPANLKIMPTCYSWPFSWDSCPYFLPKCLYFPLIAVSQEPWSHHSLASVKISGQNLFECWPWPLKGQVADLQL